jgi:cell division protein FtsZ
MSEPGKAMMGTAVASGPDRATKAADLAVACPLLEGIDLSGAPGPAGPAGPTLPGATQ